MLSLDWDRKARVTPVRTKSQEAWPGAELGGDNRPTRAAMERREASAPGFGARRARKRKRVVTLVRVARIVTKRLSAFHFLSLFCSFVARMERSEIRERRCSRTVVPGLRFAPSGLRAEPDRDGTGSTSGVI